MLVRLAAVLAVLLMPLVALGSARAADQVVLGKSFTVRDPAPGGDATLRTVVALGKEPSADDTIVGNPLADGATVQIIANGTSPSTQTWSLPAGAAIATAAGWTALGNPVSGYKWKDSAGTHGPIKSALIRITRGTFIVKVTLKATLGPINVLPPAPGTTGGMRFTIGAGDTYCVNFGGAAGGTVLNAPTKGTPNKVFKVAAKASNPTTEAGCPVSSLVTTTTSSSTTTSTSSTTSTTIWLGDCAYSIKWGSTGTGNGQFSAPAGVGRDAASGNLYVADSGNDRVQKFTATGTYLTKWGTTGSANGEFVSPTGVAVDGSGDVFVADAGNNRIQKFTSAGAFLTAWGTAGSATGEFDGPTGVAADASGNVYVADSNNARIQKFSGTGTFITSWGVSGSANGEFSSPYGVATDASGNVYVADAGNNRVQKFTGAGTFLATWGTFGPGDGEFGGVGGVSTDASYVYASDVASNRVQKFDLAGTFLDKGGVFGTGDGEFSVPAGVAADGSGGVYVAEYGNDRIQKLICP